MNVRRRRRREMIITKAILLLLEEFTPGVFRITHISWRLEGKRGDNESLKRFIEERVWGSGDISENELHEFRCLMREIYG